MATVRSVIGTLNLPAGPSVETETAIWRDLHYLCAWLETSDGYTVPDTLLLQQTDKDYSLKTNRFGDSGSLIEVFGKVIYERLTAHNTFTTPDAKYQGGTRKGANIVFNWKIESQMPPTWVWSTANIVPTDWKNIVGKGWQGYFNAKITNVVIRIRKLKGTRAADGAWLGPGVSSISDTTLANPFDAGSYDEVGKIIISASALRIPASATLNDTNRGYTNEDLLPGNAVATRNYMFNRSKIGELKGYADENIVINTITGSVEYIKKGTVSNPEETELLSITWNSGYSSFDDDSYYYLTLEPENHPVNRILSDKNNYNYQLTPSDGWYGIEKVWPFAYSAGSGFDPYEGIDYASTLRPWRMIKRFEGLNENKRESWAGEAKIWKQPKDVINKLRQTTDFWSSNDSTIAVEEFHMYGFNIRNWGGNTLATVTATPGTGKYSSRDSVDAKAEYFAWFKTPKNTLQANLTFDITKASKGTARTPKISRSSDYLLTDTADPTEKKVTVYGMFHYDNFDFYLESEFTTQYAAAIAAQQPTQAALIQAEINKIKGTPKLPGEKPKRCGFRYRNKTGDNKWYDVVVRSDLNTLKYNAFTRDLPDDAEIIEGNADPSVRLNFSKELPIKIGTKDQFEYQIWVEKSSPTIRYYSDVAQLEPQAKTYPISFGSPNFKEFLDPNVSNTGFWYQMYNCWEVVKTDINRTQIPYLKRKTNITEVLKQDDLIPVHYYMDMTFMNNTNYQFRTTLEKHIHGQNTTKTGAEINDSTLSNLHVVLPWSENLKIETPYINTNLSNLSLADKTLVPNINVYMYSNINGYSINNLKSIQPGASFTDLATKPRNFIMSRHNPKNPITYTANMKFTQSLSYVGIAKSDWFIQGFATFNILNQITVGAPPNVGKGSELVPYFINGEPMGGKGWHWLENDAEFVWFDKVAPANNLPGVDANKNLPIGGNVYDYFSGKKSDLKYLLNNFIAKFIIYQNFNLSFDYLNNTPFGLSMYVGRKLPYIKSSNEWYVTNTNELIENGQLKFLGKLGSSTNGTTQKCQFYGIEGNQYLIFVADPVISFNQINSDGAIVQSTRNFTGSNQFKHEVSGFQLSNGKNSFGTYSIIKLSNFVLSSNYHEKNNDVIDVNQFDLSPIPGITNASYSITLGDGNNVFQDQINQSETYTAKAGNSTFMSGIWENGVWNNGWREDLTIKEFYNVKEFYSFNKDRVWRVKIQGTPNSTSAFKIGEKISIGNVTTIDINDKRKFLKKYYYVIDVQPDYIEFEFVTEFPIKRIERDSDEHRIMVSKNVWMNGVFFNGYFKGIWNSGIFSGYPKLAKMDESQWIDGTFNGGHFTAKKYSLNFTDIKLDSIKNENIPRLSLLTSIPHRLNKDDIISVTYSLGGGGGIKYLGSTVVLDTPTDKQIITGIVWKDSFPTEITIGGTIMTLISTGLIQNFNFYSRNMSKVTSLDTMISESVFSYDSWIDVNYSNQSAVNIGRPQSNTEPYTKRSFTENNLYGYPTTDVLSSYSLFRDSYSLSYRKYRLGSKFEIYSDYVGSPAAFEDWFDSTDTTKGFNEFETQGWRYEVLDNNVIELYAESQSVVNSKLQLTLRDTPLISKFTAGRDIVIKGPGYIIDNFNDTKTDTIYTDNAKILSVIKVGNLWQVNTDDTRPSVEWEMTGTFRVGLTGSSSMTFSRTPEPITTDTKIQGKELKVNVTGTGGILDLIPNYNVSNRKNGTEQTTTDANKYTMVEFDLIDYLSATNSTQIDRTNGISHTPLHFNNLNFVTREINNNLGLSEEFLIEASYLPLYKNINHLTTFGRKKQEFFFNKRNLMMNASGVGEFGNYELELYIDNLKFYEVNMIPFFQYFRNPGDGSGNINISIQAPRYGISPDIILGDDEIVDTETPNEIISYFNDKLISNNIDAPLSINWEQDYAIYRTQINDIDDPKNLYEGS
jgi:hypothetical protein